MKILKRNLNNQLSNWLNSSQRKPLLLIGARQVGKTFSVLEFAKTHFNDNYFYVNLMINNDLKEKLKNINDPQQIIHTLELYFQKTIDHNSLIIFDEIQELKNIRTSFKFFYEEYSNIKIIGLGSYLSNALLNDQEGFPVGKVDTINVYPLTFYEYAINANLLLEKNINDNNFDEITRNYLFSLWKDYCVVGGMPEVVKNYLTNQNINQINNIKHELYSNFINDITKQIDNRIDKNKAIFIFENIISFLAKENKTYSLSIIDKNARYRDYENALLYLLKTHLVNEVRCLDKIQFPFLNQVLNSKFKLFYLDLGFISYLLNIDQNDLFQKENESINNYRGSIGESFVINEIKTKLIRSNNLYYYKFINNGISYEIDLILSDVNNKAIPIEIKTSTKAKAKSLFNLLKLNFEIEYALYFSTNSEIQVVNYQNTKIIYLPIYMISFLRIENDKLDINKILKDWNIT